MGQHVPPKLLQEYNLLHPERFQSVIHWNSDALYSYEIIFGVDLQ
jgi:hypothetical protein